MGLTLTYPLLPIEVNGKKMWSIGEDCMLLICLARHITPEDITELYGYAPAKLLMADFCFDDTTAMANANYTSMMDLGTKEQLKILCGKEHFRTLEEDVELRVATDWKTARAGM